MSNKKLDIQDKKGHDLSQHDFPGERTTPFYFAQGTPQQICLCSDCSFLSLKF